MVRHKTVNVAKVLQKPEMANSMVCTASSQGRELFGIEWVKQTN